MGELTTLFADDQSRCPFMSNTFDATHVALIVFHHR